MTLTNDEAIRELAKWLGPQMAALRAREELCSWAEANFNIIETRSPIRLFPHQRQILNFMFDPANGFQTMVYSTVKKSGKTTIAAMVARWVAETWGNYNEVYCMANDLEQARGRIYAGIQKSIELTRGYDKFKRVLPGKWRIIERDMLHLPSNTLVRAVSSDYKGEAGSNPTATFWSELWGYESEDSKRLWDELTPVPTRPRSIRFVETYAGYENESTLLEGLYALGKTGRQASLDDFPLWPWPDQPIPVWINQTARLCMYWDEGITARRMPWQTPEYYAAQAAMLRPLAYERLHLNKWTSGVSQFIPIEWYDANIDANLIAPSPTEPIVVGIDAAVSGDCAAIVGISRKPGDSTGVALRFCYAWAPEKGQSLDYGKTIEPTLRQLIKDYNVVQLAYDEWQLHDMMTRFKNEGLVWVRKFSQGNNRTVADKQLYDLIKQRRFAHNDQAGVFRKYLSNCAAKQSKEEDTRFRIIKKSAEAKIDPVIAASMAAYECLRLNLAA
jgi:hypothetical protein